MFGLSLYLAEELDKFVGGSRRRRLSNLVLQQTPTYSKPTEHIC